jgi:DNA-binding NtrC family response regulator
VRVIAVTQSNLDSLVEAGTFRQELFFQLKPFSITSPPLRDRAEDIGLLADAFVADACREFGLPAIRISAETHTVLRNRDWPANLRELRSVLREAVMRAPGTVLLPTHLSTATTTISPATKSTPTGGDTELAVPAQPLNNPMPAWETYLTDRLGSGSRNLYAECLTAMERQLFEHVLRFTENDTAQAAEILGFTSSGFEQRLERIRKNSMRIM